MTAEQRLTKLLLQASGDLQKLYDKLIKELTKATSNSVHAVSPDELYTIAKACTPTEKERVQALLDAYSSTLGSLIKQGITRAVLLSANIQQKALSAYTRMQGKEVDDWRESTAKAFINSRMKRDGGLNLSDRVWNYTQQTKAEFELAMSQALENGIKQGISAESLGRQIRQYLNNPDMMYRRYHLKKAMADGTKRDVEEWRRRVIHQHCNVRVEKEDLAHVGTGVYRSARQNALRLTITETNMAYNYANCERWSSEPYVLGIRIRTSANHPEKDICDELAGDYPKDFMWRGWHPRCRCSMSSILIDRDSEEWEYLRSLPEKEYRAYKSPNLVPNVPEKFSKWCERNADKLNLARENGKLPYFVRDNQEVVGDLLGWKDKQPLKHGYMSTKLGRKEANEAYKYYVDSKPIKLSDEQKKNVQEIAKEMGITKNIAPMTFFEANNGRANVNYGKGGVYQENCQSCVIVHEARLRGLDITALGYSNKKDSVQFQLGEHIEYAWISPKTGKEPIPTIIKGDDLLRKAVKQMQAVGRYHVGINYNDKIGHVITIERTAKNDLLLYDPQSGDFLNLNQIINSKSLEILRVDKLVFKKGVLNAISEII
nr:MAG TPA: Papain fold toxin 1, glutamine deamidase [Caudoviricetes sp.]